ncbi:transmembrane protein, putative [Medicago truncatula]|uniref:Transmembrane protein, putative n=1 Tax=Medicago truncatula TaxID=3880 RepID=G7J543_MEDTR|nr:transmembrane protein, putative [Medicago truncatula]
MVLGTKYTKWMITYFIFANYVSYSHVLNDCTQQTINVAKQSKVTIVTRNGEGETTRMVETHNEIDGATLVRFEGEKLPNM